MGTRTIRQVPDPVLRATCTAVTDFNADLADLAQDMLETMYAAPGRGLAAPQVGETLRLFVMDATWKDGDPAPQVFVNPQVVDRSDATCVMPEGCLSIPGPTHHVERPSTILLRWQTVDGAKREGRFEAFPARCIQHEVDHLDGVLCTDYPQAPAP